VQSTAPHPEGVGAVFRCPGARSRRSRSRRRARENQMAHRSRGSPPASWRRVRRPRGDQRPVPKEQVPLPAVPAPLPGGIGAVGRRTGARLVRGFRVLGQQADLEPVVPCRARRLLPKEGAPSSRASRRRPEGLERFARRNVTSFPRRNRSQPPPKRSRARHPRSILTTRIRSRSRSPPKRSRARHRSSSLTARIRSRSRSPPKRSRARHRSSSLSTRMGIGAVHRRSGVELVTRG
jgi:hypothetical protein